MACDLLSETFRRLHAERPDWYEGQPEWVIHEGLLIERTRCVNCHIPLPEGHHKFCGDLCGSAHRHRMATRRRAHEERAVSLATHSI